MEKFIPLEKMSKKAQRAHHKAKRGSWGETNPVTRAPQNPKAYNRKKTRREVQYFDGGSFLFSV